MKKVLFAVAALFGLLVVGCAYPYLTTGGGVHVGASVRGGAYNTPVPYIYHVPGTSTITQEVIVGGGFRGYGGCYAVSGWQYNEHGYPVLIPRGTYVGNCPDHHKKRWRR